MTETKSITLRSPVVLGDPANGGLTYDCLDLREPVVRELIQVYDSATGYRAEAMLISVVSGVPIGAIERLVHRDFLEAQRFLASFSVLPASAAPAGGVPLPT